MLPQGEKVVLRKDVTIRMAIGMAHDRSSHRKHFILRLGGSKGKPAKQAGYHFMIAQHRWLMLRRRVGHGIDTARPVRRATDFDRHRSQNQSRCTPDWSAEQWLVQRPQASQSAQAVSHSCWRTQNPPAFDHRFAASVLEILRSRAIPARLIWQAWPSYCQCRPYQQCKKSDPDGNSL